jgi:hypothetical protein
MKPFNEEACNFILYFCREAKKKGYQGIHIRLDNHLDKYPDSKFEDIPYSYYQAKEVLNMLEAKGLECLPSSSCNGVLYSTMIIWENTEEGPFELKYVDCPLTVHITPVINSKLPDQWDEGITPRYQDLEIVLGTSGDIKNALSQEVLSYLATRKGWDVTTYTTTDEYGTERLVNSEAPLISTLSLSNSMKDLEVRRNPDVIEAVKNLGTKSGNKVRVETLTLPADKQWFITYDDDDSTDSSEYIDY